MRSSIHTASLFLGYTSIVFQWLWTLLPLFFYAHTHRWFEVFLPQHTETSPEYAFSLAIHPFVAWPLAILSVVFVFSMLIYGIMRSPQKVSQSSEKVVKKTAHAVASRQKNISKTEKSQIEFTLSWSMRIGLVALPLLGVLFPLSRDGITPLVAQSITLLLFAISACCITVAYISRVEKTS